MNFNCRDGEGWSENCGDDEYMEIKIGLLLENVREFNGGLGGGGDG